MIRKPKLIRKMNKKQKKNDSCKMFLKPKLNDINYD